MAESQAEVLAASNVRGTALCGNANNVSEVWSGMDVLRKTPDRAADRRDPEGADIWHSIMAIQTG